MSDILDKIIDQTAQDNESFSSVDIVSALLELIKEREAEILRLRFGLSDNKRHTLEEIGKKMDLTRERVRQLENVAKSNIKKHRNFDSIIAPAKQKVAAALLENGGLASKERIARAMLLGEEIEKHKRYLEFLVDNFIDEVKTVRHDSFLDGWYLRQDYLDLADSVVKEIKRLIEERKKLLQEEDLLKEFISSEFYRQNQDRLAEVLEKNQKDLQKVLRAYLELSRELDSNPFNQWGLVNWSLVRPRRVNDKIYLVLKHYGKPMHFRDIAEKINQTKFDNKVAHPATIHNDLISDSRFVLVGKGVYALKEWGYKSGVVPDLIVDILKEADEPLSRQDIIIQVLKQRNIKPNTVVLALNKDERFEKTTDGKYRLREKK